jgi:hypothetical protein
VSWLKGLDVLDIDTAKVHHPMPVSSQLIEPTLMSILEVGDDANISHMQPLLTQYLQVEYGLSFVESKHKVSSLT